MARIRPPPELTRVTQRPFALELTGAPAVPPPEPGRRYVSLLYSLVGADSVLRSLVYEAEIAGFEPLRKSIELGPLLGGSLPFHRIELVPRLEALGGLEVELRGALVERMRLHGFALRLQLRLRRSDGMTLSFPIDALAELALALEDVPTGDYAWRIHAFGHASNDRLDEQRDRGRARVDEGRTTRLVAELPPGGLLAVEFHERGMPVAGTLMIAAAPGLSRNHVTSLSLLTSRPGEALGLFPPGDYEIRLMEPQPLAEGLLTVTVQAGALHTEHVVVR